MTPLQPEDIIDPQFKVIKQAIDKPSDKECPYCLGTGKMAVANGRDDYDYDECFHLGKGGDN